MAKEIKSDILINGKITVDKVEVVKAVVLLNPIIAAVTGEVSYVGMGTGLVAGNLYYFSTSGSWVLCDAGSVSSSTGMLGIALGTSISNGMLLRGLARFATASYTAMTLGQIQYASTTPGSFSGTPPSGTNKIVRVLGYCLDAGNDTIYFNPDNTWVELS